MASTRNKNTIANFELEKKTNDYYRIRCEYLGTEPHFSGNGIMPGNMHRNSFATNSIDIESQLFGITTNLVNHHDIIPELKKINIVSLFKNKPVIHPDHLIIDKYSRSRPFQSD